MLLPTILVPYSPSRLARVRSKCDAGFVASWLAATNDLLSLPTTAPIKWLSLQKKYTLEKSLCLQEGLKKSYLWSRIRGSVKQYTIPESARILSLSTVRVGQLIRAGKITAVKLGRDWLIEEAELLRFKALVRPPHRPPAKK